MRIGNHSSRAVTPGAVVLAKSRYVVLPPIYSLWGVGLALHVYAGRETAVNGLMPARAAMCSPAVLHATFHCVAAFVGLLALLALEGVPNAQYCVFISSQPL